MLLVDYVKLLARKASLINNTNYLNQIIEKRIFLNSINDESFDDFKCQLIDSRKVQVILSLAILISSKGDEINNEIKEFFWKFMENPNLWNLGKMINRTEFTANIFRFLFKGIIIQADNYRKQSSPITSNTPPFDLTQTQTETQIKNGNGKEIENRLLNLLLRYCNDLLKGEYILDVYVPSLVGYFRGLVEGNGDDIIEETNGKNLENEIKKNNKSFQWSPEIADKFLDQITNLLQMELFDIRVILTEIPKGSGGANDLLNKHYQIVYLMIESCRDNCNRVKFNNKSIEIFLGYIAIISSYLMESLTLEVFLISLVQLLSDLIGNVVADTDELLIYNSAMAIINSFDNFRLDQHYFDILDCIQNLLIVSSRLKRERSFEYLNSLKLILRKLAQNVDLEEHFIDQGSKAIGKCLGTLLFDMLKLEEAENYCESYISNFMTDLPENTRERESFIIMAINVLSNIAMKVKDDKITKICLTSLLIQYRSADGIKLKKNFYFQFNSIASTLGTTALSNVLDIYSESLISPLASTFNSKTGSGNIESANGNGNALIGGLSLDPLQQLILALENLAEICKSNIIKTELFVHFIIKSIVEKALEIIKTGDGIKGSVMGGSGSSSFSSKRQSIVSSSPIELGLLLSPLGIILEDVNIDLFSSKHALIESFQQIWFILVFFGFQPSLNWPSSWIPFIRIIASKTPILVKERDKIQTESSLFSQLVLDRSSNPTLKTFLSNLASSHSNLIRHLTMAQCLWILSFYMSEKFKLQSGVYEHIFEYVNSDIIRHLDIYPVVETLTFDLVAKWMESRQYSQKIMQKFASFTLEKLCNPVKSVHALAKRILEHLYAKSSDIVISSQEFWYNLLEKIQNQYMYSKFTLVENVSKSAIRDPVYARETFTDLINIARLILNDASHCFPRIFYISIVERLRLNKKNQSIQTVSSNPSATFPLGSIPSTTIIPPSFDQNIRDIRIIELLRLCLPKDMSGDQLLDLPMNFIDTPEDYLKWIISEKL